jgi:hypothetical protein
MTLNKSASYTVAFRREFVARFQTQGFTQRAIALQLSLLKDPNTHAPLFNLGRPYNVGTINRDIKHLEAGWLKRSQDTLDVFKARELAELAEVKRLGFLKGDLHAVVNAIKLEAQLRGTLVVNAGAAQSGGWEALAEAAGIPASWLLDILVERMRQQAQIAAPSEATVIDA